MIGKIILMIIAFYMLIIFIDYLFELINSKATYSNQYDETIIKLLENNNKYINFYNSLALSYNSLLDTIMKDERISIDIRNEYNFDYIENTISIAKELDNNEVTDCINELNKIKYRLMKELVK